MKVQQLTKLNLPDVPGVYTFRDSKKRPLYIGRATSLRDRVKSYFRADVIDSRGPRIVDMVTKSAAVTWDTRDSVLEAIMLESELIKRYQPFYNVDERDNKSSYYVIITDETWPRVFLGRARDVDQEIKDGTLDYKIKYKFGPFPESGLIKEALKMVRHLFPFRDKKALDPKHERFYRMIGQSPEGGDEKALAEYKKTVRHLALFFQGKKSSIVTDLKREMKAHIKALRFEEAGRIKKLMFALDHINDIALLKKEASLGYSPTTTHRIEAYDVAHLGGMENVGVMVVSMNGQLAQQEYRKFKISKNVNNDIAALAEILERRLNHPEWSYPDIIAVDGGETHLKHAEAVLAARRINIPVVAVTKDDRHKGVKIQGNPDLAKKYEGAIFAINAEAHRFAITYHRQRRGKRFVI